MSRNTKHLGELKQPDPMLRTDSRMFQFFLWVQPFEARAWSGWSAGAISWYDHHLRPNPDVGKGWRHGCLKIGQPRMPCLIIILPVGMARSWGMLKHPFCPTQAIVGGLRHPDRLAWKRDRWQRRLTSPRSLRRLRSSNWILGCWRFARGNIPVAISSIE